MRVDADLLTDEVEELARPSLLVLAAIAEGFIVTAFGVGGLAFPTKEPGCT